MTKQPCEVIVRFHTAFGTPYWNALAIYNKNRSTIIVNGKSCTEVINRLYDSIDSKLKCETVIS